ncbi:MAG TPA: hypothetical protein VIT91_12110 [Chthoniobacterales bacterium]
MYKYSTTVGLPVAGDKATSQWQVTIGFNATQSKSLTDTVSIQKSIPIAVPALTTTVWKITFTDQNYSIPFTVPVQLTGAVAIRATSAVSPEVLSAVGGQQVQPSGGGFPRDRAARVAAELRTKRKRRPGRDTIHLYLR